MRRWIPSIAICLSILGTTIAITGCHIDIEDKRVDPKVMDSNFRAAQAYLQDHENRLKALETKTMEVK